jgi:tetratricopeptide (TPR) repeat protein
MVAGMPISVFAQETPLPAPASELPPQTTAPTSSPATAPTSQPVTVREMLFAAAQGLQANKLKVAERWFSRALVDEPANVIANLGLAKILVQQENLVAARIRLEEFVRTQEGLTSEQAYLMLGRLYLQSNLARQARFNLLKAYDLNPADADIRASLAVAYKNLNDHENELKFARLAVEQAPENAEYASILVGALLANSLQDEADDAARQSLITTRARYKEKPEDFDRLQAMESQTNFLMRVLLGHLQSEPTRVDLLIELADLTDSYSVIQQGIRNYNAMRYVMQAGNLRPNDPKIILRIADYQRKVLKLKDAFNTYRRVLALDPDNEEALKWIAKISPMVPALQEPVEPVESSQSAESAESAPSIESAEHAP